MQLGVLALALIATAPPWRDEDAPPPAEGDTASRLRVHFDLEGAYWQARVRGTPQGARLQHDGAGVLGYKRIGFGFGLGWGLGDWLVVGARGDLFMVPGRAPDGRAQLTRGGSFSPYAELLFARVRGVRPFLLARAGLGGTTSFAHDAGEWSATAVRSFVPSVGLGLGTHAFITEDLAFDLMVVGDYRWNLRPRDGKSFETGYALVDAQLLVGAFVGFSRWF